MATDWFDIVERWNTLAQVITVHESRRGTIAAMRANGARAIVAWRVEDIQNLVPEMSAEDAMAWLENNESNIAERMTERGWDAIYDLLNMDGIKIKE